MIERIKKVMEKEGSNPSIFADQIGISRSSMNHILNGRNNPSLDVLVKILIRYENLNSDWLLFGKLPMYKGEKTFLQPSLFDDVAVKQKQEPIVPEYRREKEVKLSDTNHNDMNISSLEIIKQSSKTINKIMIFYSDNTFDSFSPDKQLI